MNCDMCKEGQCCPSHCCDWDTCKCKDCEQCGGPARPATFTTEVVVKKPEEVKSEPVPPKPAEQKPERSYKAPVGAFATLQEIEARVKAKMQQQKKEEDERRRVEEEARAAERKKYADVLQSTKDFLAENKKTISSTQDTLTRLQGTLDSIKETEKKFKNFQDSYDKLFADCLNSALGLETETLEALQEKHGVPRGCDLEEAAARLAECRNVVFVVGAGVSVESGVPTYKGNDEKWEIDGEMLTHEEMATARVMTSYPFEFWQKQHFTKMQMMECRPNATHYAVGEFYNYWRHIGRSCSVITQNIDNYDREVLGPDADLFEVHGNLEFMRCMTECCDILFPAPDPTQELERIPMCPACQGLARPHILLFDESYSEKFYKSESAVSSAQTADCIVVLGTQLKTGLASKVVTAACKRPNTLVIEINVEPVIPFGQVLAFTSPCGEVVPQLVGMAVQQAR